MEAVHGESSAVIEEQLDAMAEEIEEHLDADLLTVYGAIQFGLEDYVRTAVEHDDRRKSIAVVLETVGGYIDVAERIVNVLRHNYKIVDFYVPNMAMSAGTVLVMSGDSIHMDYFSVLGPIDPQIPRRDGDYVPALGYLEQYQGLMARGRAGNLSDAELAYLIAKFDPADIAMYEHQRDLSISLLEEWLTKYKFKNWTTKETSGVKVTPTIKRERAREIGEKLTDTASWHSHGRGLTMDVLRRKIGLRIDDIEEDEALSKRLRRYHRLVVDYAMRLRHWTVVHRKGLHRGYPW